MVFLLSGYWEEEAARFFPQKGAVIAMHAAEI